MSDSFKYLSPSPFGGSKKAEYLRSIELFEQIYKTQGLYFALAFLYDSQYERKDISKMMELIKPKPLTRKTNDNN